MLSCNLERAKIQMYKFDFYHHKVYIRDKFI